MCVCVAKVVAKRSAFPLCAINGTPPPPFTIIIIIVIAVVFYNSVPFYVLFLQTGAYSPSQSEGQNTVKTNFREHTRTHARTHTHTHTHTHTYTHTHTLLRDGKTFERQAGAHMGFSERIDTIFN